MTSKCPQCESILKQTQAAIGVEPGAAVRHVLELLKAAESDRAHLEKERDKLAARIKALEEVSLRLVATRQATRQARRTNLTRKPYDDAWRAFIAAVANVDATSE